MKSVASEQSILNSIIQILLLKRVLAVHVRNTGVIIHQDGKAFFGKSKFDQKGAADLIFAYKGVPVACEVKSPIGRLRPEQVEWLKKWQEPPNSGYSFVARSVDDVLNHLTILDSKS